jgi:hypothetical protein
MKTTIILSVLAAILIALGCNEDPSGPTGTLPVVQNLAVLEDSCEGQTVFLTWEAVDVADLDGYEIWYRSTDVATWGIAFTTADTCGIQVATQTGFYRALARKGLDTSSDYSNEVNTLANRIWSEYALRTDGPTGLVFGENGAVTGDAADSSFAQDIYVGEANNLIYVYSGNHDPENYPGGADTKLAPRILATNVAPEPSSSDWVDSVQVSDWDHIFVMLDDGYYVEFQVADTVYTTGFDTDAYEYQTIRGLRLFNVVF